MSSFTQFSAKEKLEYSDRYSRLLACDCWRIVEGYRFYIGGVPSNQYVDVPTGYITDGASLPRFLWSLIPPIGKYTQATTVHDYLCNTYQITETFGSVATQIPVTREEIDKILFEALKVLGVARWKQLAFEFGVNLYRWVKRPNGPKRKPIVSIEE